MVPATPAAGSAGARRWGSAPRPRPPPALRRASPRGRSRVPRNLPRRHPLPLQPWTTRSGDGRRGTGHPLTRLCPPSAAPRRGSRKPRWGRAGGASAGVAGTSGPAGAALSRSGLSLFQVGVPQINSLVPLKKRKNKRRRKLLK